MKLDVNDFWASWDMRHAENQEWQSGTSSQSCPMETELDKVLHEPLLVKQSDPLLWWRDNATIFPMLSKAAQRYLSSPATSVPSERLFSSAGDICSDKRTCLLAENVKCFVFS